MSKILKELKTRWTTESPEFFVKVQNLSITLGTSATAVLGADKLFDLQTSYNLPGIIFTMCGYIIIACASTGLLSKITIK